MAAHALVENFEKKFAADITDRGEFRGEHSFTIKKDALKRVLQAARDELGFDYLIDISSVDHLGDDPRFEVVYELYSLKDGVHLRVKTTTPEDEAEVPSVVDIWPTADWHEREVYDMMGIRFSGHPDLRRILMWEGYPYHPLRKDFPLEGRKTDVPEVAFTDVAPLAGGPFVTVPGEGNTQVREPRSREPQDRLDPPKFIPEP